MSPRTASGPHGHDTDPSATRAVAVPPQRSVPDAELIAAVRALPVYGFSHARTNFEISVASGIHTQLVPTSSGIAAAVDCGAALVVVDVLMGQALLARGGLDRAVPVIVVDHASPELWSVARALGAVATLAVDDDPETVAEALVPLVEHWAASTPAADAGVGVRRARG